MFSEDEFIQISGLQHYVYCPRQWALIHIEDVWTDNVFTVRGEILHEKVDTDTYETRGTKKTVRGLRIHSTRLGIVGRADVIEFKDTKNGQEEIMPVEFKSGEPKEDISDKVQLCAQALCLEEMMNVTIRHGAFFYGRIRRRFQVELESELRKQTEEIISKIHEMATTRRTPPAEYSAKCRNCSLESICVPKAMNESKLKKYIGGLYSQ
ncbi:MAG: CRISPR-associated protein Cas4 [Bacteroidota bacterium]